MPDAFDKGPFCAVQKKLPVIGRAVAGALDAVTQDHSDRFVFALFVIDTQATPAGIVWTCNGEREGMWAALSEFLAKQSH